jgi:hypothetical protein
MSVDALIAGATREYAAGSNAQFTADASLLRSESLMRSLTAEMEASDVSFLESIDRQYVKADSLAGHMRWRSERLFNPGAVAIITLGSAGVLA